jgi:uncharacterized protein (TIGR00251 family)
MATVKHRNRTQSPCVPKTRTSTPASGLLLTVRVTPRADRDSVAGVRDDGVLLVRTSAAPVDGAANDSLVRLVAESLGVRPASVTLVAGHRSREKRLLVSGVDPRIADDWRDSLRDPGDRK